MIELNRWYEISTIDAVYYRAFVVLMFRGKMRVLYLAPIYDPKHVHKIIGTHSLMADSIDIRKITNMRMFKDKVHPDITAKELCKKYGSEVNK